MRAGVAYHRNLQRSVHMPRERLSKEDQKRFDVLDARHGIVRFSKMLTVGESTIDCLRNNGEASRQTIEKVSRILKELIPCLP